MDGQTDTWRASKSSTIDHERFEVQAGERSEVPAVPLETACRRPMRLIGRGWGRECYEHPFERELCVKVPYTAKGLKDSLREERYCAWVEWLHGDGSSVHVAARRGRVSTSHGCGWLFDQVCEERTSIRSPTMAKALDERSYAAEPEAWERAFDEFFDWCDRTALLVRDVTPDNLCVQRLQDGRLRLVLIDGLGTGGWLLRWVPLRRFSRRKNRSYARRRGATSMRALVNLSREVREGGVAPPHWSAGTDRYSADRQVYLLPPGSPEGERSPGVTSKGFARRGQRPESAGQGRPLERR